MTKDVFGVWTVFVSLIVGFMCMVMFYGHDVGISYPLFVGLLMTAVVGSGWYARYQMNMRNLWLLVPALGFAVMVAVRADDWLTFWNVIASLTLSALALHYLGIKAPFDLTSTFEQFGVLVSTSVRTALFEPFVALTQSLQWFKNRDRTENESSQRVIAVVRGAVVTLPVLVVFGVLLGSADLIFAEYLGRFGDLFNLQNVDELVGRAFYVGVFTWFSAGVITYAFARDWSPTPATTEDEAESEEVLLGASPQSDDVETDGDDSDETADASEPPKRSLSLLPRISMIEGGMLLGGVNLLFGAFVLVQFVYLFGGRVNVTLEDFTYAEYARRGFFELVTVAVMTMALLLSADRITVRDGKRENWLFRVLSIMVIVFVSVMLLSAARRMALYTDAFGLTRLRLWVSVFMAWMAVLFVVLVLSLFRVRKHVFSLGLVLVAMGYLTTLNLMVPDARIAAYNLGRVGNTDVELDVCYIDTLSADAIPVILDYYENSDDETTRERLAQVLRREPLMFMDTDASVFAYNRARARADRLLNPYEAAIMPIEVDYDMFYCYTRYGYEDDYAGYR